MKKVAVIYNPFSGKRKVKDLPHLFGKYLDSSRYEVHVWPTEKADDVLMLTQRAIQMKFDIVFGAGGDGTMNGIATGLVNTGIAMGIIPLGSGNGLARHFKIPMRTEDAIRQIPAYKEKQIDTIWINKHCMVNIGGLGFDAQISAAFANKVKRGLKGYLKTIAANLNYKSRYYKIFKSGTLIWEGNAFMIGIANATQWGNNVRLLPGALPDDGLLHLLILRQFSIFSFPGIVRHLLQGKLHLNRSTEVFSGTDFRIEREQEGPVHTDGEPLWLGKEININIEPLSLRILDNA